MSANGLTITLSHRAAELANQRAATLGFSDVGEYLETLIAEDGFGEDYGAPAQLQPKTREELEALLTEGLHQPTRTMTRQHWDQMKQELIAKHQKRKS
jgi:hypothetical protein